MKYLVQALFMHALLLIATIIRTRLFCAHDTFVIIANHAY